MIYFIEHTDFVNIGFTNDIKRRLSQLQVSSPIKLKVILLIDGDVEYEQKLHREYNEHCSCGEWFHKSEPILKLINSLDKEDLRWDFGLIEGDSSIGSKLKKARIEKGMTLDDVGIKLGVTKQSVRGIEERETLRKCTLSAMMNYAHALDMKLEYRIT